VRSQETLTLESLSSQVQRQADLAGRAALAANSCSQLTLPRRAPGYVTVPFLQKKDKVTRAARPAKSPCLFWCSVSSCLFVCALPLLVQRAQPSQVTLPFFVHLALSSAALTAKSVFLSCRVPWCKWVVLTRRATVSSAFRRLAQWCLAQCSRTR